MNVVVLGASPDPSRYAYLAAKRLVAAGHQAIGVNPKLPQIPSLPVVRRVAELPPGQHTLTVYVSAQVSHAIADEVIDYGFKRVVFNPGSENPALMRRLADAGVEVVPACTLVMLSTGEF